ncbi:hypothetical protein [Natronococcus sp. A-GB7]|uniref:hypothetical protein n=1 Tax=Natronococcus sp. A-GB7 TaxID=3037649 RepID=UPI00241DF320|nr:hypothetical protein [Natronococcus sp. A-GB7]MDG5821895.1 hypothetical protein [Natronococcus sp. A-GB7]
MDEVVPQSMDEKEDIESDLPKIAVFAGPRATILNTSAMTTSNKAREKYGLDLLTDDDDNPIGSGPLRPQRLATSATVYIEAFSAHPLEEQKSELYADPDGYIDPETGEFSDSEVSDGVPAYEVTLKPEDGLYMLPYMARKATGEPWDSDSLDPTNPTAEESRVPFFPDGSRLVEQIDRFGIVGGTNNSLSSQANFDYYRPAPPGGYEDGLPEEERTDEGDGDIPPETWGEDFFTYAPVSEDPTREILADATNEVQAAMDSTDYEGGFWLESSASVEETIYWINLLIDTKKPICGNGSQQSHGDLGNRGDRNVLNSVEYINSGIWKDDEGRDKVGAVLIQEEQAFTARDVEKVDDRPGGYETIGGHGGIVADISEERLTFVPERKHTWTSEVNVTSLPRHVTGVQKTSSGKFTEVKVEITDSYNKLQPSIPDVTITKGGAYSSESLPNDGEPDPVLMEDIERKLESEPLAGFIMEGSTPYGGLREETETALEKAALRGMPVVTTSRGRPGGFMGVNEGNLFIEGENFGTTKARLLLMAAMMKLGSLPVPSDPDNPSDAEIDAIQEKIAEYQEIFNTH